MTRCGLGQAGEEIVAAYLLARGWKIIERNWRCKIGELDIVALEGNTLVFIEVKTRIRQDSYHPFDAITSKKLRKLESLIQIWRNVRSRKLGVETLRYRLDLIGVTEGREGQLVVECHERAPYLYVKHAG
jgi:putative endonuclease